MVLIEDGYSDGINRTQRNLRENFAFRPGQAQVTPWVGMETDKHPAQVGNAIIRHARRHTKQSRHSYLPCQPPQVSNLFAASDPHPGRVLDDLCQRPLSGGGQMIMG